MADPVEGAEAGTAAGEELEKKLQKSQRAEAIARASASEATRRASSSAAEAQRYKSAAEQGQVATATSKVAELEAARDKLQGEYQSALEGGDFKVASELNFKMNEVAAELVGWRQLKTNLEGEGKDGGKGKDKPQLSEEEKREAFINSKSPETAAWLRAHPEYFTDPNVQNMVHGAHNLAMGKKIKADTPEYFEFVEKTAGMTGDGDDVEEDDEEEPEVVEHKPLKRAGQKRPLGAPGPSREQTGAPPKIKSGEVHLNAKMMEGAKLAGIEATDKEGLKSFHENYVKQVNAGEISDWAGIMRRR